MKTLGMTLPVVLTVLLAPGPVLATGQDHTGLAPREPIAEYRELTDDERSIQSLLDVYAQAMEARSVETAEQAVIPGDFSTIESGYANWTWEDFKQNHLSVELESFSDISYVVELIAGEFQGDLGFAIYQFTASGEMNGQSMVTRGLATAILEKSQGQWRIHHIHSSTPRAQHGASEAAH